MVTKLFIDTNILIDLFDGNRPNHAHAIKVFEALEQTKFQGYVTESVLNTTAYLLRKIFTTARIKTIYFDLLAFISVIEIDTKIYREALHITINDIEDAVLYAAALEKNINLFVTSNTKDFKKIEQTRLPIISSADFVKNYL